MDVSRVEWVALVVALCLLVPATWACDNLAASSCTQVRDSCRYPNSTSVNTNSCTECWPSYFTCVQATGCEDNSFYGSTAITSCISTDGCNATVCAFAANSASAALLPNPALGALFATRETAPLTAMSALFWLRW